MAAGHLKALVFVCAMVIGMGGYEVWMRARRHD
jgi:hypothetical protein